MIRNKNLLKCISLLCVTLMFFGCATSVSYPERFKNAQQAFSEKGPGDIPHNATNQKIYEASYADVFEAVKAATAQAQLNFENYDGEKGVIKATRRSDRGNSMYFYGIVVDEVGPESTSVTIFAKSQTACSRMTFGGAVTYCLGSFLILTPAIIPIYIYEATQCTEEIGDKIEWEDGQLKRIDQVFNYTRNNLIAAGAI